jgi:hypothetical protein
VETLAKISFLILAVLGQQPAAQEPGRITGVVLNAQDRTPMAQTKVVLTNLMPNQRPRETTTNGNGAFTFDRLPPNGFPYFLKADKSGYRLQAATIRIDDDSVQVNGVREIPVDLKARMQVHAELRLTSTGVIAGRISDHERRAVPGASVELIQMNGNRPVFGAIDKRVTADAEGNYRFDDVLPGEYVVQASMARMGPRYSADAVIRTELVPDPFSAAYYPGVSSRDLAARVKVTPTSEFRAADVVLQPSSPGRISGRIKNSLPFDLENDPILAGYQAGIREGRRLKPETFGVETASSYSLYLVPKDKSPAESSPIGPLPDHDDNAFAFELKNIPFGSYELYVVFRPNTRDRHKWHAYGGRTFVKVDSGNVTGIEIQVEQNADVTLQLVWNGSLFARVPEFSRNLAPSLISVDSIPGDLDLQSLISRISGSVENSLFRLPVPPGRYWVGVMDFRMPKGVYLDTVTVEGTNIFGMPFTIGAGSTHRVVLNLRSDGGNVDGTVTDRERRPVGNASVVLLPPDHRRDDPAAYRLTTTNARGQFTLEGIRPDTYTILAFSELRDDSTWRNASFFAPHTAVARRLEIKKGDTARANLEAIVQEVIQGRSPNPPGSDP